VSTPGSHDDETEPVDAGAAQALPADAGVAAPGDPGGARARGSAEAGDGDAAGSSGGITDKLPSSVTEKASGLTEKLPDTQEKPEVLIAGAFVGGFLFAKVLRRIAGV
jgi:hypothetical protein